MKIYTKTGDRGTTGLIGGTRVPKNDPRLDAYGSVDELNAFIGFLTTFPLEAENRSFLQNIQHKLFTIGANLATDRNKVDVDSFSIITESEIEKIEKEIDRLDRFLPALKSFVLPGGSQDAGAAHICRTVARRVERRLFDLREIHPVDEPILIYINRLSDYFFVLARYLTVNSENEEFYWKKQEE
jgi:cob(I)alamin adenosyltransferase